VSWINALHSPPGTGDFEHFPGTSSTARVTLHDFSVVKNTKITEKVTFSSKEMFNLF